MIRVLFVCHGNICRSTAAETLFHALLEKHGKLDQAKIDSCGVSDEEEGNPMYPPMRRELESRGIRILPHYAREITPSDFREFDYILYMDRSNLRYLRYYSFCDAKVLPITDFAPNLNEIEDPWYTGRYNLVVNEISACLDGFYEHLLLTGELK